MRVAVFLDTFPVVSETFILRQITGLIDLGHEVDIYAARTPAQPETNHPELSRYGLLERTMYLDQYMPEASGTWEMPIWPIGGDTWLPGSERPIRNVRRALDAIPIAVGCLVRAPRATIDVLDPREYGYQARSLSALYRLSSLGRGKKRYDILHAHFGPTGSMFRFTRKLWNAPLVVSFHGYDYTSLPRQHGPGLYSPLFRDVDGITANSSYAGVALQRLGCPAAKIHRLNYGIDLSSFKFQERNLPAGAPIHVLTVGRLVEKKGIADSIRAFARMMGRYPNSRYDIIGEGSMRAELDALIGELGARDRITLVGAMSGPEVRHAMAAAHLFVLASVTAADGDQEGTPVSLLEAQAMGLPVVSTHHSGIPEIVADGQSGYLVPERDVNALAGRLSDLFEHPEIWSTMGREGRRLVEERHDISQLNLALVALYDRILQGRAED